MKQFLLFAGVFFSIICAYSQQNIAEWHVLNYNPPGDSNRIGAICPIDENVVYVISGQEFYKSPDSGTNWVSSNINVTETFFDLVFFDANLGFAVGTNGTILKTSDGGNTWISVSTGTTEDLFSMAMISFNDIWVVGHYGTILHSTDGGNTWFLNTSLSSEKLNSVGFNGNTGYIAGNNGTLLYTSDYGVTWTQISLSSTNDFFSLSVTENNTQFLVGDVDENYPFYYGYDVYKTTDNINWVQYPVNNIGSLVNSKLHFVNDNLGFLLSSDKALCDCSGLEIHRTTDAGQTWELSYCASGNSYALAGGYSDLAAVNDTLAYAFNNDHLFKTTNAGAGWAQNGCKGVYAVERFDRASFTIYPNPSQGNQIHIEFENLNPNSLSIEIIDITGKQVLSIEKGNTDPIDISGLETGMYFVNILKNGKTIGSEKLIKSN